MKININNKGLITRFYNYQGTFEQDIEKVYQTALNYLNIDKNIRVNISFVGAEKIRELNKEHRNVDRVTDVLSFPLIENYNDLESEIAFDGFLDIGDIVVNLKRAKEQAIEYGHSFRRELVFLCLHGFLHLLGYDHMTKQQETEMFGLQNLILNKLDILR